MKKRYVILLTVTALFLSLSACGKKQDTVKQDDSEKHQSEVVEKEDIEDNSSHSDEKTENILTGTYNVPLQDIYVDTPAYNMIEAGYSRLFMVNDVKYVAFTCLYKESETDAKVAFQTTFNKLKDNLHGYHQLQSLNEVEEQNVTVNDIATYKIQGTANCGKENPYNAYIYGYSFVYQGFPCSIVGVVEDREQLQSDIDEITEVVDAMMKSVRSER